MDQQINGQVPLWQEFKILISTDNHVGYMEKDPVRGNDSFVTFNEVLQIAAEHQVDFVLLGGDLFHDNRPSVPCIVKTLEILRSRVMGSRPIAFDYFSDPSVDFHDKFAQVNIQNPDINIQMPIFTIHGNHDDPSQQGYSSVDILSNANYVNYFGKQPTLDKIEISPLLLKKGGLKIAIYGLGNVRDERLYRCFREGKVTLLKHHESESDDDGGGGRWFNILVLHQNRVKHTDTSYVPEGFIDPLIDLVFWGHEHDCRIDVEYNDQQQFYITQPGSSIATSLSDGESIDKHVGILTIGVNNQFNIQKVPLKTVRPFVVRSIVLQDSGLNRLDQKGIHKHICTILDDMVTEARRKWREQNVDDDAAGVEPPLPLIRLKIDYTGEFTTFHTARFSQQYVGKVANPKDLVYFFKRRLYNSKLGVNSTTQQVQQQLLIQSSEAIKLDSVQVDQLVNEYLNMQELTMLPESGLHESITKFVQKDDKDAIREYVDLNIDSTNKELTLNKQMELNNENDIIIVLKELKARKGLKYDQDFKYSLSPDDTEFDKQQNIIVNQQQSQMATAGGVAATQTQADSVAPMQFEINSAYDPFVGREQTAMDAEFMQDDLIFPDDDKVGASTSRAKASSSRGRSKASSTTAQKRQRKESSVVEIDDSDISGDGDGDIANDNDNDDIIVLESDGGGNIENFNGSLDDVKNTAKPQTAATKQTSRKRKGTESSANTTSKVQKSTSTQYTKLKSAWPPRR
ncbi:hypothetical protein MIR68_009804 [Amoeboaphelidium protococcarum]|nr:hypothetical protein MIR68_009804 [Amoeboaphelidium protococcarum]